MLTSISLSTHLPAGVLLPILAFGATFGRLFEYIFSILSSTSHAGIYAAVGAASLVSATTHTISVTVIVFEMTGQIHYLLPMIVSVLIAYTISSSFSLSIYDSYLEIRNLPYLPSLKPANLQSHNARDIMELSFPQLSVKATLKDLIDAIDEAELVYNRIPIVDNAGNLLYDVNVTNAKEYFKNIYYKKAEKLSKDARTYLDKLIMSLEKHAVESIFEDVEKTILMAEENEEVKAFLLENVEFNDEILNIDDSPFAITETTQLSKTHFLFIMLGLSQVYIIRKGFLIGTITRESFTKRRNIK